MAVGAKPELVVVAVNVVFKFAEKLGLGLVGKPVLAVVVASCPKTPLDVVVAGCPKTVLGVVVDG